MTDPWRIRERYRRAREVCPDFYGQLFFASMAAGYPVIFAVSVIAGVVEHGDAARYFWMSGEIHVLPLEYVLMDVVVYVAALAFGVWWATPSVDRLETLESVGGVDG